MRCLFALVLCLLSASVSAQASAQEGRLRIESDPPGASIIIDDNTILGRETPATITVAPGLHRVMLRRGGSATYRDTVTVRRGETAAISATLQAEFGQIAFDNLPAGSTVRVNGAPFGPDVPLPLGPARVEIVTPDDVRLVSQIQVARDLETVVSYVPQSYRGRNIGVALVAPGALQIREGRIGRGRLFAGAFLGGLVAAGAMTVRASAAVGDTAMAQQRYDMATNEAEAVAAREDLQGRVGAIRSSRQIRTGMLVGVGLVYVVSLVDSFARHVRGPALVSSYRAVRFGLSPSGRGASFALTF